MSKCGIVLSCCRVVCTTHYFARLAVLMGCSAALAPQEKEDQRKIDNPKIGEKNSDGKKKIKQKTMKIFSKIPMSIF